MKKFLIKCICLVLVTVTTFSLCGCFDIFPKEFEVGDFRVRYQRKDDEDGKDPNSYLCLLGLSEVGQKKKTIVLPKKINGHPYYLRFISTPGYSNTSFHGKMEKFYFEYPGDYAQVTKEAKLDFSYATVMCLKKMILNFEIATSILVENEINYYYNYKIYRKRMGKREQVENIVGGAKLANLQYMYNYNESPNEGYFWIDDIDNGEKVEIIPDTPEREGYTFEGWYNEKECINKFDFETVFNKPVLNEGDIYPEDYVTYLYAKWIQNEG